MDERVFEDAIDSWGGVADMRTEWGQGGKV